MRALDDPFWGSDYQDYVEFFKMFGVELQDESGQYKSSLDVYKEIADRLKQVEEIEAAGYVCSDCKSFDMDESYDGVICWCKNGRDIDNDWNHKACIDFVPDS